MKAREKVMNISELLGMFFEHCLPCERINPSFMIAPLQFILVCKRWKNVAEGMPGLWCRFRLDFKGLDLRPENVHLDIERCRKILDRFLRCSRKRLLDVELIYWPNNLRMWERSSLEILNAILYAQQDRWSDISLQILSRPAMTLSSRSLRHLHMDWSTLWKFGASSEDIRPSLKECSSLKDLMFTGFHIEEEYNQIETPACLFLRCPPSLQTLEIRSSYIYIDKSSDDEDDRDGEVLDEIERWGTGNVWKLVLIDVEINEKLVFKSFHIPFSSLTWLEIRHLHDFQLCEDLYHDCPPIKLERLQHLCLQVRQWDLLSAFRTPNVVSLDLEECYYDDPDDRPDGDTGYHRNDYERSTCLGSNLLMAFIERNRIALEVFHLIMIEFEEWELIESLACMPSLKELRVTFLHEELASDHLLLALTERSETQPMIESSGRIFLNACHLCPVLTTFALKVDEVESLHVRASAVVNLVKSRQVLPEDGEGEVPGSAWKELALPITAENLTEIAEKAQLSANFLTSTCEEGDVGATVEQ